MTRAEAESAYAIMAGSGVLTNLLLAEFRRTHGLPPLKALTLDNTPIAPTPPRAVADLQGVEAQMERYARRPARRTKPTGHRKKPPETMTRPPLDPVTRWDLLDLLELGEAA